MWVFIHPHLQKLSGKAGEIKMKAFGQRKIPLEEEKPIAMIIVLPLRAAVSSLKALRNLMPHLSLRDIEDAVARTSCAPAPIDLLPNQEELRLEEAHLFNRLFADKKGTSAGVADIAHFVPFLIEVAVSAAFMVAADRDGVDISAGVPNDGGIVIIIDLCAERPGIGISLSGLGELGQKIGGCSRVIIEEKHRIGPPLHGSADADVAPFRKSQIFFPVVHEEGLKVGIVLLF